jgi:hypothetical protein
MLMATYLNGMISNEKNIIIILKYPFILHYTPFGRGERNGIEWKNKNILRIFFPFSCLEV